jgi:regulatory protein
MEAAGRLLGVRARSEVELRQRLTAKGFDDTDVDAALGRLRELRLIDDEEFARQWVEQRSGRKGLGAERLRRELGSKGIASEVIESVLADNSDDELERAKEIAAAHLRKFGDLPLPKQAARLFGFLSRRGFAPEVVDPAVRAVLPPEGWD